MRWLKYIGLTVALLIVIVLVAAAFQPDQFRVERSTVINTPPEPIFAIINDLHRGKEWSPYEKKDPAMERHFEGPVSGVGAVFAWKGNKDVGAGRMEILESTPSTRLRLQLDFIEPFAARNHAEYLLTPEGNGTRVTWSIDGPMPFLSKVMCLFFDMDQMIGRDFEAGLADLKQLAEREAVITPEH